MNGQNQNPALNSDPATEPIDLAQAFKMYNQANREAANSNVADNEPDENQGEPGESGVAPVGSGEEQALESGNESAAEPSGEPEDNSNLGGSADVIEPIDINARKQEILKEIQRNAIAAVRQDFANNKITPCTIEDIYSRDESSGRVSFKNPDDPTRDFASRAEAQQWVDAFNKQIDSRFRQEVNKKQQELLNNSAPILRLIDFAPKFNALDKTTQDILDDLIEPYSIVDNAGNVIGFNADLDAALVQAKKIAKRFSSLAPSEQGQGEGAAPDPKQEGQASRPAMNLPTGKSKSVDEAEPKTIGEALKMYDKQQRELKKKKGSR